MSENFERKAEKPEPYWTQVREIEEKNFAEFAGTEGEVIEAKDPRYYHFRLSYFFKAEFITEEDVQALRQEGKKLLSIGSGPAYLERTLQSLGVPNENVVISDISDDGLSKEFRSYVFDMHSEEWPKFEEGGFDLIIIPEAFGVSLPRRDLPYWAKAHLLQGVVTKSLDLLKPNGELRMIDPSVNNKSVISELQKNLPHSTTITIRNNTVLIVKTS